MSRNSIIRKIKFGNIFIPLLIVIISCSSLIFTNYFTIKILSASRAYINGESHYSKGQKDATRHLITFLFTKDANEWDLFNKEISVPKGDKIARIGLMNNAPIKTIEDGFIAGRNDEKDINDMIWLFKNFKSVSFFKKAINEWEEGDQLIEELESIGNEVYQKTTTDNLSQEDKQNISKRINTLSVKLTQNEHTFSETLGNVSRRIKGYLLFINIFFTLVIVGSVSIYYYLMFNRLRRSKEETEETNKNLTIANRELDKFVYSATHDLKAPIYSLKGLIEITKSENDIKQIKTYLALMNQSLDKQEQFIKDIIDYSRNKKTKTKISTVSLKEIVEEAIAQNQYRQETNDITIIKKLTIDTIYSDDLKLKIIINNLISNAVKYSDNQKDNPFIVVKAYEKKDSYKIIIEDNGIGINQEYQDKIFEMFFVTNNNKGSGIGLYLVKDAVEDLNGKIKVSSEINIGSKFTITLPKKHDSQQANIDYSIKRKQYTNKKKPKNTFVDL